MGFDWKLAWWQMRGQANKSWILIFCIALGVAARVSIGSFMGQLDRALLREARSLLAADLEMSGRTPLSRKKRSELRDILPSGSRFQDTIHFISMAAAPSTGRTKLVELKAVESDYPFYGKLRVSDQNAKGGEREDLRNLQEEEPTIVVQSELLTQLQIDVGDKIRLGKTHFKVQGTILEEPGTGASLFSLGPKVMIGIRHVPKTDLVRLGSNVYYSTLVSLPDPSLAKPVSLKIKKLWNLGESSGDNPRAWRSGQGVRISTFLDKQRQMRRFFDRLGDYLRLVSLIALLLGGIGVGAVVRGFVMDNLPSIATLKTLGSSSGRIIRVYFFELIMVGFAGSCLGIILGIGAQNFFPLFFSGLLPVTVHVGINLVSILWGLGLGLFVTLYFGMIPLLEVRRTKPMGIFRGESTHGIKLVPLWIVSAVGLVLFGFLAVIETRSLSKGSLLTGALLAGGFLLYLGSRFSLPGIAGLRSASPWFGLRHGMANLIRPGLHPTSAIVSLGLSAFLLGVISLYQYSFVQELDAGYADGKNPNFFLIDIQDDQVGEMNRFLIGEGIQKYSLSPMIKARYRSLNREKVQVKKALTREGQSEQRMRNREQNLSYRFEPGENETIIDGTWMKRSSEQTEASLEEWFARRLGAAIGDLLVFDVQGVEIQAKVTSIRKVRWASFLPTFFILISPQVLEEAPKTWVGAILGLDRIKGNSVQTKLVRLFPNVTLLDLAETTRKMTRILGRISWSVQFVGFFSLGAGLVVLMGVALSTARQRRREAVLLKILGARSRTVLASVAVEFGFLSAVAVLMGLALSAGFGWFLLERLLDIPFKFPLENFAVISTVLILLSSLTGILVCQRVFVIKPLEVLREEL